MGKVLGAIYPLGSTRSGAGNRAFVLCFICCVFFLSDSAGRTSSGIILYQCSVCVTREESLRLLRWSITQNVTADFLGLVLALFIDREEIYGRLFILPDLSPTLAYGLL